MIKELKKNKRGLLQKFLLLVALFSFIVSFTTLITYAGSVAWNYEVEYIDNATYSLNTGVYESSTNYSCTNKIQIRNASVFTGTPLNAHYILFWNKLNIYIGYYTIQGTQISLSKYLGVWVSGVYPSEAYTFALVSNKSGVNTYPLVVDYNALANGSTFDTIYNNPSYLNYTDSILPGSLQDSYETVKGNQLIKNTYFSDSNLDGIPNNFTPETSDTTDMTVVVGGYGLNRKITITILDSVAVNGELYLDSIDVIEGHYYYFYCNIGSSSGDVQVHLDFQNGTPMYFDLGDSGEWLVSWYCDYDYETITPYFYVSGETNGDYYEIYEVKMYDVSDIYGVGNEPTTTTFYNVLANNTYNFGSSKYEVPSYSTGLLYGSLVNSAQYLGIPTYSLTKVLPTNLITNGDFSTDSNSDGLADNWDEINPSSTTATLSNDIQYIECMSNFGYALGLSQNINTYIGNKYYISFYWDNVFTTTGEISLVYLRSSGGTTSNFYAGSALNDGNYSYIQTSSVDGTTLRFATQLSALGSIFGVDNAKMYDISALKLAGLFGGMSDTDIKTVLDDYVQNGLTLSNQGYFYATQKTEPTNLIVDYQMNDTGWWSKTNVSISGGKGVFTNDGVNSYFLKNGLFTIGNSIYVSLIVSDLVNGWIYLNNNSAYKFESNGRLSYLFNTSTAGIVIDDGIVNTDLKIDDVLVYNISTLKSAGLFVGKSNAQIKTILDDYAVNGLTASNAYNFYKNDFQNLTITQKNDILELYGVGSSSGTFIDFSATNNYPYAIWNDGIIENFYDNTVVFRMYEVAPTSTYQQFYDGFLPLDTDVKAFYETYTNPYQTGTTRDIIDVSKYGIYLWRNGLTSLQQSYYDLLYWDSVEENQRWEWYYQYGILTTDLMNQMFTEYSVLSSQGTIDFTTFSENEVFFLIEETTQPGDLDDEIDDRLTEFGWTDLLKAGIGLIVIAGLFILIAIKKGEWGYYLLAGVPGFIVFAIIGWFPWWLSIVLTAVEIIVLFLIIGKKGE